MRSIASTAIGALAIRARSKNLRLARAQHAASIMGPTCGWFVEPVEAGIGVGLHQARIGPQMLSGWMPERSRE